MPALPLPGERGDAGLATTLAVVGVAVCLIACCASCLVLAALLFGVGLPTLLVAGVGAGGVLTVAALAALVIVDAHHRRGGLPPTPTAQDRERA